MISREQRIRVAAETAISLALEEVEAKHPGSIPSWAGVTVKRSIRVIEQEGREPS